MVAHLVLSWCSRVRFLKHDTVDAETTRTSSQAVFHLNAAVLHLDLGSEAQLAKVLHAVVTRSFPIHQIYSMQADEV